MDSNRPSAAEIVPVTLPLAPIVRELFKEYAAGLKIDLCFQHFDRELASLPGDYAEPAGRLLLAFVDREVAGCIALRPMEDGGCEIKRLYVRPPFRRRGLGRTLVHQVLKEAVRIGYPVVRLDTLCEMKPAIALYAGLGFKEVAPYRPNEPEGICYFELRLKGD
jgi:ribosomal protein S18 acetylase RimI-like enzyme